MRKAFVNELTRLAASDPDVILITGDLGFSVFDDFQKQFPTQFINAGLCEQAMIGMAAGLALEGKKVFVYSIIPFLVYRALEQIRNDLCYQRAPVKLIGVGTGVFYGPLGGTHHAIEDVGVMTSLPGLAVMSPGDPLEVETLVRRSMTLTTPSYMRIHRSGDPIVHTQKENLERLPLGAPWPVSGSDGDVTILAVGSMLPVGDELIRELQTQGVAARLYSMPVLKPVEREALRNAIAPASVVMVLEEVIGRNNLADVVSRIMVEEKMTDKDVIFAGLPDAFIHEVGSSNYLKRRYGLDSQTLQAGLQRLLSKRLSSPAT